MSFFVEVVFVIVMRAFTLELFLAFGVVRVDVEVELVDVVVVKIGVELVFVVWTVIVATHVVGAEGVVR